MVKSIANPPRLISSLEKEILPLYNNVDGTVKFMEKGVRFVIIDIKRVQNKKKQEAFDKGNVYYLGTIQCPYIPQGDFFSSLEGIFSAESLKKLERNELRLKWLKAARLNINVFDLEKYSKNPVDKTIRKIDKKERGRYLNIARNCKYVVCKMYSDEVPF